MTSVTPSKLPELAAIKEKVMQDMYAERARKALQADLATLRSGTSDKKRLEPVLKGEVTTTEWIDPQDHQQLKKLEDKKLPVDKMVSLTAVRQMVQDLTPEAGFVVELHDIEPFNEADFLKKKSLLDTQVRHAQKGPLYKSLIDSLRARAKIDINTDLIQRAGR